MRGLVPLLKFFILLILDPGMNGLAVLCRMSMSAGAYLLEMHEVAKIWWMH